MKKYINKKGFTLIELLAVIVIIALVAIITIPIVGNIVNDAKKSAAKDSAYGYIEAIEYANSLGEFSEDYGRIKDGTYKVSKLSSELSFKGNKPTYGNVTIEKGVVTSANLCIGGYMVNYDGKEATVGSKCIEKEDTTGPNIVIGTISGTTNSLKIPFRVEDPETGIESVKCYYTKEKEFDEEGTIKEDVCTFKGLNNDKEYEFKIVAVNGAGMNNVKIGNTKTGATSIAFSQTKYPTDTEYSQYKNIGVTFSSSNVTNPVNYIKTTVATTSTVGGVSCGTETDPGTCSGSSTTSYAADTWYKVEGSPNIKFTSTGTIYARINDGESYSSAETLTITKIDTTAPNLTLGDPVKTTKAIKIPIIASDLESEIASTTCVYGTSTSYGSTGTVKDNVCTFSGNANTTYYYKVVTTNGSGLTKEETGNTETGTTSIAFSQTKYPTDTEYSQYKNVGVTFSSINVTNPVYYVKTTVATTSTVGGVSCGTETDPENCSESSTTSYAANTWYKVTSSPNIKFTDNGSIYARVNDGTEYSSAETITITKIDTTAPTTASITTESKTDRVTLTATCTDNESGISKYEYSKDNGSTWVTGESAAYVFTGLDQGTSYSFKVRCTNGSGLSKEGSLDKSTSTIVAPSLTAPTDQAPSKDITVTYNSTNIVSPVYYVKGTIASTISVAVTQSCGTSTNPGTCSTITSTTNLSANTWYKVTSSNVKLTITDNGSFYAATSDGKNLKVGSTLTVTSIVKTASDIYYNNSTYTNGQDITVQEAIEDLYNKLQ